MTDNIFEIETAAIASRTCYSEDPGTLLAVTQVLRLFLRAIYNDTITYDTMASVAHAGAARGQFAMMRGVRQGCLASGYLFTMAFGPVYRWLMPAVLPPEPPAVVASKMCLCLR